MALGIKGKKFADSLQLGHDVANTVGKQVQSLVADNLKKIDQLDLNQSKPRANKNDKYYIEQASKALDLLFDMYLQFALNPAGYRLLDFLFCSK